MNIEPGFQAVAVDGGVVHALPDGLLATLCVHDPVDHVGAVVVPEGTLKIER